MRSILKALGLCAIGIGMGLMIGYLRDPHNNPPLDIPKSEPLRIIISVEDEPVFWFGNIACYDVKVSMTNGKGPMLLKSGYSYHLTVNSPRPALGNVFSNHCLIVGAGPEN
jgi:hypothetical protein